MHRNKYDALTPSQKKAVEHIEGPLLVIAGPGSGKTRVITYRIAALVEHGVNPRSICAITFTNKAAQEMLQRTLDLGAGTGVHISTFHSLCARILREYHERAGIKANYSIYSESEQNSCIRRAIRDCELDSSNFTASRVREAISSLKNRLISADAFKSQADDFFSQCLSKIYVHYQRILEENNALDFDDLLLKTAFLLEQNKDVRKELSNRFKFLLIDEYQDTNYAQYQIARHLVCEHNNICVTGDPDQSIYRWRGADIRNILAFESDWPGAVVIKLEENFRSTPNILKVADNLISFNRNRKPKTLIPTRPAGADVIVRCFEDHNDEAEGIVVKIIELADSGVPFGEIAIFYRVNSASRVLEESLIKYRIPYQVVRGVEFYSRKEIRDILAYLRVLVNPDDEEALLRIINTPLRGIGKTTVDKIRKYASDKHIGFYEALKKVDSISSIARGTSAKIKAFVAMLENLKTDATGSVASIIERVFTESGLEASLRQASDVDAIDNITELTNAAAVYDKQTDEPSLLDYLQQIALFTDADSYDPNQQKVTLMTLHAAKGLEFDSVFIVGLEDGLLPHERSGQDEEDLEEERRLFFVGITRARKFLHLSYAKYRTYRGQLLRTVPSQFLYELGIDFNDSSVNGSLMDSDIRCAEHKQICRIIEPNQVVRHKKFGLGRILKLLDMGENSIVTVRFDDGRTRTLMLKYAGLEVVDT